VQPIVFIAAIAVGATLLGTGILSGGNEFQTWVQKLGTGEAEIGGSLIDAELTFVLDRMDGFTLDGFTAIEGYKDVINECEFTSQTEVLLAGTKLFCKLLDGMDVETSTVIAEGILVLTEDVPPLQKIIIPVDMLAFDNSNNANIVQNVLVLVQAPPQ